MIDFNTELTGANSNKKVLDEAGAKPLRDAIVMVSFEKLVILPEYNVREYDAARGERTRAIADDMKANGFKIAHPLEVFIDAQGRIIVDGGHTRYDSIALARSEGAEGLESIPVVPHAKGTSMLDLTVNLVRSNSGAPLSGWALSLVVKRLTTNFNKTPAEAAKLTGMSAKYANQLLLLAGAPIKIRELGIAGAFSATFAIQMIEEYGDKVLEMIEASLAGKPEVEGEAAPKKKITKKDIEKSPEAVKKKLIQERAEAMFQLTELLLSEIDKEDTPEKEKNMGSLFDKLDIIVAQVNAAVELAS